MVKLTLIKQLIQNHNNSDTLASFYTIYKNDLILWIKSKIFSEALKNEAEDILHNFIIDLMRYDVFKDFRLVEDEKYLINSFNKYVKNVLLYRCVIKYVKKREINYSLEERIDNGDENSEIEYKSPQSKIEVELSKDRYNHEEAWKLIKENLTHFKSEYCKKKNQNRDFEICIKSVIDGASIDELAKEYGVSKSSISMSIFKVKEKLRRFLK